MAVGMHCDPKVRILQIDSGHPVAPPHRTENQLVGLHLQLHLHDEAIQMGNINP